ncbi:MAG: transcription antitermination factor NusB [Butyribacter sp.]|nr:transcription antitermination factor NusB [bacterium]MDY3854364.1 transcription antitermination factor NusB [Butyribacter sp.]
MTRKRIRENLYIMLFQINFHDETDVENQAELYLERMEDADATQKAKEELKNRFRQVLAHASEIDEIIEEKSQGWTVSRLAKADLTILRLAVFEILYDEEVPNGVAINEAVELAKKYGGDKSPGFVNGVLATIAKEAKAKEEKDNEEEAE